MPLLLEIFATNLITLYLILMAFNAFANRTDTDHVALVRAA